MTTKTQTSFFRRNLNLRKEKIGEVLPGYFQESYPNLILFLEKYYDALATDGAATDVPLYDLFSIRDLDESSLTYLDKLFYEISTGVAGSYFRNPRVVGKFIYLLIQNRGNEFGAQAFFRLFFDDEPEVQYPKTNIFIVGESNVGDSLKYIQDGAKYQFLSVLIRSGISINKWSELYKKFVHPAGFYLSSEVVLESKFNAQADSMPLATSSVFLPTTISLEALSLPSISFPTSDILIEVPEFSGTRFNLLNRTDALDVWSVNTGGAVTKNGNDDYIFETDGLNPFPGSSLPISLGSGSYTYSVDVKVGNVDQFVIGLQSSDGSYSARYIFIFSTEQFGSLESGIGVNTSFVQKNNGWYRLAISVDYAPDITAVEIRPVWNDSTVSYTINYRRPQIETGVKTAFETVYQPVGRDGIIHVLGINETISKYADATTEQLTGSYDDITEMLQANSPTFDEDSDGTIAVISMANTIETMDANRNITTYDSDSA
jgi:hypothetical protein